MKNLTYTILGFVVGAVLTYYFCPRELENEAPPKVIKPNGVISIEKAKELNTNWTLYRKPAVDSAAKRQGRNQDDRSTYWSLNDVQNYLAYAQNEADSLGYKMSGLRVYLGVYGKNAGQAKKDLTTMFMVPTGNKKTSQASFMSIQSGRGDLPIDPLNDGSGGDGEYPQ